MPRMQLRIASIQGLEILSFTLNSEQGKMVPERLDRRADP